MYFFIYLYLYMSQHEKRLKLSEKPQEESVLMFDEHDKKEELEDYIQYYNKTKVVSKSDIEGWKIKIEKEFAETKTAREKALVTLQETLEWEDEEHADTAAAEQMTLQDHIPPGEINNAICDKWFSECERSFSINPRDFKRTDFQRCVLSGNHGGIPKYFESVTWMPSNAPRDQPWIDMVKDEDGFRAVDLMAIQANPIISISEKLILGDRLGWFITPCTIIWFGPGIPGYGLVFPQLQWINFLNFMTYFELWGTLPNFSMKNYDGSAPYYGPWIFLPGQRVPNFIQQNDPDSPVFHIFEKWFKCHSEGAAAAIVAAEAALADPGISEEDRLAAETAATTAAWAHVPDWAREMDPDGRECHPNSGGVPTDPPLYVSLSDSAGSEPIDPSDPSDPMGDPLSSSDPSEHVVPPPGKRRRTLASLSGGRSAEGTLDPRGDDKWQFHPTSLIDAHGDIKDCKNVKEWANEQPFGRKPVYECSLMKIIHRLQLGPNDIFTGYWCSPSNFQGTKLATPITRYSSFAQGDVKVNRRSAILTAAVREFLRRYAQCIAAAHIVGRLWNLKGIEEWAKGMNPSDNGAFDPLKELIRRRVNETNDPTITGSKFVRQVNELPILYYFGFESEEYSQVISAVLDGQPDNLLDWTDEYNRLMGSNQNTMWNPKTALGRSNRSDLLGKIVGKILTFMEEYFNYYFKKHQEAGVDIPHEWLRTMMCSHAEHTLGRGNSVQYCLTVLGHEVNKFTAMQGNCCDQLEPDEKYDLLCSDYMLNGWEQDHFMRIRNKTHWIVSEASPRMGNKKFKSKSKNKKICKKTKKICKKTKKICKKTKNKKNKKKCMTSRKKCKILKKKCKK